MNICDGVYFVKVTLRTIACLKWIRHLARNLRWLKHEKDKKAKENMKELLFQIKANTLYKLPKWRTHEISNRLYWGLGVVPKTNDKIYVLISMGKYIINFHLFFVLCQKRYCCWKYLKGGSHLKNLYHYAKVAENTVSPYCTLLFCRKENFNFFEVALPRFFYNDAVDCIMNVWRYQH